MKRIAPFSPLFNPNIDLLQAVKVTKSGHHLSHDRASKGYGSTPCLTSQTSLHACLQRLNTMQISLWRPSRNRTIPPYLLGRAKDDEKSRFGLKRGKKAHCVSNRCKDLFERKKYFGVRCTLIFIVIFLWRRVIRHK